MDNSKCLECGQPEDVCDVCFKNKYFEAKKSCDNCVYENHTDNEWPCNHCIYIAIDYYKPRRD